MGNDRWAWDRYWQADRVASCMDLAGRANYDARIAQGWREFFAALPRQAEILDLCTGNGAIALLAAETSQLERKEFIVTGVDRAAIDPARFARGHRDKLSVIRFQGQVSAEELPFENGSFGAVTSQYGIEYSSLNRSMKEAVRVLRPHGRLRFGLHAAEGKIFAKTKLALADAEFLLAEADLADRAKRCFETVLEVERSPSSEPRARKDADRCFAEFQQALGLVADRLPRAADRPMLQHSAAVLLHAFQNRRHFPLPMLLDKVEEISAEIEAHRIRQQALVDAAITREQLAELASELESLGMIAVRTGEQRAADELLGHSITAELPG